MQTPASSRPPSLTISNGSEYPTNTIIIPSLPLSFFQPNILNALHDHFAMYGDIYAWSPLKGFRRILVVYYHGEDAEAARESDGLTVGEETVGEEVEDDDQQAYMFKLRVYRGDPTPISAVTDTLHPPELEHNFLISPPGSPPVGWEQTREEPPNQAALAHDLVRALEALRIEREREGRQDEPFVLLSGDGEAAPAVTVQDLDWHKPVLVEERAEWNLGVGVAVAGSAGGVRTARPPVRTPIPRD